MATRSWCFTSYLGPIREEQGSALAKGDAGCGEYVFIREALSGFLQGGEPRFSSPAVLQSRKLVSFDEMEK